MATGFDFASLGNLFAPGGTPSGLDALFNEDQRRLMGRNANLSAAAALLLPRGAGAASGEPLLPATLLHGLSSRPTGMSAGAQHWLHKYDGSVAGAAEAEANRGLLQQPLYI